MHLQNLDVKSRNAAKRCCDKVNFETFGFPTGTEVLKFVYLSFVLIMI